MPSIVVDAGPLIALFLRRDRAHPRVRRFLEGSGDPLATTLAVVTEAANFLDARGKLSLFAWIRRGGLALQAITRDDLDEIGALVKRYADRDIDFADASLIWLADRLNTTKVLTLDRTDFTVYRRSGGKAFDLVLG